MLEGSTVILAVLDVFTEIGVWFSEFVSTVSRMFWVPASENADGYLTFMGVLAVAGLAFSVVFLVIGLISNFLHFRG